MTWAFEQNLPANEKVLLLSIADYCDDDGWCFPSQEVLAEKASMSVATVRRLTTKLVERELLQFELRYSHTTGYRTSNGYRLPLNLSDRPTAHRSTVSGRREPSVNSLSSASAKKKPKPTATTIPEDFDVTPEMRSWAAAKCPGIDVDFETEKFIDHAHATGREMVDWVATWRTWMRRAEPKRPPVQQTGRYGGGGSLPPQQQRPVPPAPIYPKVDLSDTFMPPFPEPPRRSEG